MRCASRSILGLVVLSWSVSWSAPGLAEPAKLPGSAAAPAAQVDGSGVKTIIVIRHAEAEPTQPGGDPALTADGQARAVELARVLGDTQLRSVYSTHFQRNRKTIAQLPRHTGETPKVIDKVADIVTALRGEPWGSTALVVGHSNTVSELIHGLTGRPLPDGEPVVFDRMWIVTMARDGTASLLRLHYGATVAVPAAPQAAPPSLPARN